jgi:hypothetical protein
VIPSPEHVVPALACSFVPGQGVGYAVGGSGTLFKTEDGGVTWRRDRCLIWPPLTNTCAPGVQQGMHAGFACVCEGCMCSNKVHATTYPADIGEACIVLCGREPYVTDIACYGCAACISAVFSCCRSTDGVAGNLYEVKFITERTGFILGARTHSNAPQ